MIAGSDTDTSVPMLSPSNDCNSEIFTRVFGSVHTAVCCLTIAADGVLKGVHTELGIGVQLSRHVFHNIIEWCFDNELHRGQVASDEPRSSTAKFRSKRRPNLDILPRECRLNIIAAIHGHHGHQGCRVIPALLFGLFNRLLNFRVIDDRNGRNQSKAPRSSLPFLQSRRTLALILRFGAP